MLFIDGPVAAFSDLTIYESSIQNVAAALHIDLTSKLELTKRRLTGKLRLFLRENGDGQFDTGNVVVTPELCQWLILRTLAETYRDAFHSELNDRYGAKWKAYVSESQSAEEEYFEFGVGVVSDPIRRPELPSVRVVSGIQPARTYYVRTAWVSRAGEESAPSDLVAAVAPDGSNIAVNPGTAPFNAAGWTVYAGASEADCGLQTPTPLSAEAIWTSPATGLRAGMAAGSGQEPELLVIRERCIWKG